MIAPDRPLVAMAEACIGATEQGDADRLLTELVDAHAYGAPHMPRAEVETNVRSLLAYWAARYGAESRARVERLYRCAHPLLGPIAECGEPTPEQAMRAGEIVATAATDAERNRLLGELQAEMRAQHNACTGCGAPMTRCGPRLWAQQMKCCPDCSHGKLPVIASAAVWLGVLQLAVASAYELARESLDPVEQGIAAAHSHYERTLRELNARDVRVTAVADDDAS